MESKLNHLAVIMDGNRRWAKKKHKPVWQGHEAGYKTARKLVEWCSEEDISYLTLYTFSSENWHRSPREVSFLMKLLKKVLNNEGEKLVEEGICLKVIGNNKKLPVDLQDSIAKLENKTADNKKFFLNLALSYGGREDIVQACQKIKTKDISVDKINEETFSNHLSLVGQPDPDLMIRTGGEKRLSNFLLWHLSYTELLFLDVLWPDFSKDDFYKSLAFFKNRQRRFGK